FGIAAIFSTVGVIYSPSLRIFGFLFGPIWLPVLCIILGLTVGFIMKNFITDVSIKQTVP
ncbi:MAG TPA: hypothetical protein VIO64_22930, partial [Pseudobacteroides sp.]